MPIKNRIRKELKILEKKKIISRKPEPIIPFVLFFISLILLFIVKDICPINKSLLCFTEFLVSFTLAFAIVHWLIVKVLRG